MKADLFAVCGVPLALAVAMHVVVRRSRLHIAVGPSANAVVLAAKEVCYFQKDEHLEAAAAAEDAPLFPIGCSVKLHHHGVGKVVAYNKATRRYSVEVEQKQSMPTLSVGVDDIERITVRDFFIYPIKSCGGIRLESAQITARGIRNDRSWMFTDTEGNFISQRRYPKMALIATALDSVEFPTSITLLAPGMESLRVPIVRESKEEGTARVWRSTVLTIDQGDAAAKWINTFLADVRGEKKFRLVRMKEAFKRSTNPKYAPEHETVFADGYPFLLAVQSSLDAVNETLVEKIPMDRFRPNIVLSGTPAFADESWNCIMIGGLRFRNVKPCERCKVSMTPARNGSVLGFHNGSKHSYYFGTNMVAEDLGRVTVGSPVKVLTMKQAIYA